MYTPTPIIIHSSNTEPDNCPKCGKEEDIVSACRHCGYIYTEEESSRWSSFLTVMIFIIGIYIFITIFFWFLSSNENSLMDVFNMQIEWFKTLKIK